MRSKSGIGSRLFENRIDETARRAADSCEKTAETVHHSERLMKRSEQTVAESRQRLATIRAAREQRKKRRLG